MIVRFIARTVGAAAIGCLALSQAAQAQQQQPSAAVTLATQLLATQLLELKGGIGAYDPAIDGVIAAHRVRSPTGTNRFLSFSERNDELRPIPGMPNPAGIGR